MRSGRMRNAVRTRSRTGTAPAPSALGGRASSRTTCGWTSRSSAVSSIVMMRSVAVDRRRTSRSAAWSCPSSSLPTRARSSRPRRPTAGTPPPRGRRGELLERNGTRPEPSDRHARAVDRERAGSPRATGTRPSRRASTIGEARSSRSPSGAMIRSTMRMVPASSSTNGTRSSLPAALDEAAPGPVDHHFGDRGIGEQRLERPEAGDLVGELSNQPLVPIRREQRVGLVQQIAQAPAQLGRRHSDQLLDCFRADEPPVHGPPERAVGLVAGDPSDAHAAASSLVPQRADGSQRRRRRASRAASGSRWASTPASTARATASRAGTRAITGRPRTSAISFAPDRPARLLHDDDARRFGRAPGDGPSAAA